MREQLGTRLLAKPTVSVIIPTYNRARLLGRAITSVLDQTLQDWELLVVDDASEDNTRDVVLGFHDPRIRYLRRDNNGGAPAARNMGMKFARGEYVAFLDSDDAFLPEKLEKQVHVFKNSDLENLGVVLCGAAYVDSDPQIVVRPRYRGKVFDNLLNRGAEARCSDVIMVKRTPGTLEILWDESLPAGQDFDYLLQLSQHYQVDFTDEVLVQRYGHHGYERISTQRGDILKGKLAHLEKYQVPLQASPKTLRHRHLQLARAYYLLRDMDGVRHHLLQALRAYPYSLGTYAWLLSAFFGSWVFCLVADHYPCTNRGFRLRFRLTSRFRRFGAKSKLIRD